MKKGLKFLTTSLGLSLMMGTALGVGLSDKEDKVEVVSAASKTIYVDVSAIQSWKDNAGTQTTTQIYFRYWDGSNSDIKACTKVTDYLYSYTTSISGGGFTFRAYGSGSDDWKELKWITYSDIMSTDYNLVIGENTQDSGDNYRYNRTYKTIDADARVKGGYETKLTPSYNTRRIWCSTVDSSVSSWWGQPTVRAGVNGKANYYEMTEISANASVKAWYADIPLSATYINFVRKVGVANAFWTITNDAVSNNAGDMAYIKQDNGYDFFENGGISGATATFVAEVLKGCITCSSSDKNGYGAVPTISSNYVSNSMAGSLSSVKITDYRNHATKETYSGSDIKDNIITAQEKWTQMCVLYNKGNGTSYSRIALGVSDSITTNIAITLATISVIIAIGGFFFLRRKRV